MSFGAEGKGEMKLRNIGRMKDILMKLKSLFDPSSVLDCSTEEGTTSVVELYLITDRYDEEGICDCLKKLDEITLSGEIEFSSDDNDVWKFYYDAIDQKWTKDVAQIVYMSDIDNMPDSFLRKASIVWEKKRAEKIKQAIETLEEDEKIVITYIYFDGMTIDKTAESLHIKSEEVEEIRNKALRKMRDPKILERLKKSGR